MKAVLQRVSHGSVSVQGEMTASISGGLVILLGIGPEDNPEIGRELAQQIAQMRIFTDRRGKINLSLLDTGGEALVVPQFTLYADTSRGHRPSFTGAAPPELARRLVDDFVGALQEAGVPTECGRFGAHMLVQIDNDGPVTIVLDTEAGS